MYLSRLTLNRSRRALFWAARPYRVHQRLTMACPPPTDSGAGGPVAERLLYRIEANHDATIILVQSPALPDWRAAFQDFAVLARPPEDKALDWPLVEGQLLAFRLRANPTRRQVCDQPGGDGRKLRIGITDELEQLAWLARKGEAAGFRLLRALARQDGLLKDTQTRDDTPRSLAFLSVQFDGALQVLDPERLRAGLAAGIGSGKALGFGLLSLAPLRG